MRERPPGRFRWSFSSLLASATAASTVTYLIPFFSTVAGVLILGDALTWNEPVGGVVVIAGVAVSQGRLGRMARVWMGSRKAVIPS